ncbi:hypothetical protein [Pseudoxanthomonas mexicana]|uniref:hypothetical protein n=1 Tax=Pseudoxanthomonas mexicana TaxID=128785 RepID=UPI003CE48B9F
MGWRFVANETFEFSALAKLRPDGFEVRDLGRAELARNGIDHRLIEDREIGVDFGLAAKWWETR